MIDIHHDLCGVCGMDLDRHFSTRLKLGNIDHWDDSLRLCLVRCSPWRLNIQIEHNLRLLIDHHTGLLHAQDRRPGGYPILQDVPIWFNLFVDESYHKYCDPNGHHQGQHSTCTY